MQSYPPTNDDSQLIREAKIGFSIVLLVVSAVGYWGYSTYTKYRTQIPDHVRAAPVAQLVGPDDYLQSLEFQRSGEKQFLTIASDHDLPAATPTEIPDVADRNNRLASYEEPAPKPPVPADQTSDLRPADQYFKPHSNDFASPSSTQSPPAVDRQQESVDRAEESIEPAHHQSTPNAPPGKTEQYSFPPSVPMPLKKVSSDDNNNTANVAHDISKRMVPPNTIQAGTLSASDALSEQPASEQPASEQPASEQPASDPVASNVLPQTSPIEPASTTIRSTGDENNSANDDAIEQSPMPPLSPAVIPIVQSQAAPDSDLVTRELEIDKLSEDDIGLVIEDPEPRQETQTRGPNPVDSQMQTGHLYHVVSQGDSLWSIATAVYDDGRYFRALHQQNRHQLGNDGQLSAGTQLETPQVEELHRKYPEYCPPDKVTVGDEDRCYVTAEGDTLFGIARDLMGQASRYLEIYELNRSRLPRGTGHLTRLPADVELLLPR